MQKTLIRKPVASGKFYPSSPEQLKSLIGSFIDKRPVYRENSLACMLPHAGYIYSGRVAVETLSRANIKNNLILLGTNHTGYGLAFSIMTEGKWQTPLGEVAINSVLAKHMLKSSKFLEEDSLAHTYEHSIEVQLPILQYFRKDFSIVPITVSSQDLHALKMVGLEIAAALEQGDFLDSTMIISSSDMTHYESQEAAVKKDSIAIEAILALDEDKLMEKVRDLDISMCGYMPTIVMLVAAKKLGAKSAKLIKYETSANATGDASSVVGYAGVIIH